LAKVTIARQFCGPPNSGNGGYVCGMIAKALDGPAKAVLRAPVPLDIELALEDAEGAIQLSSAEGLLIGMAAPGDAAVLPEPPASAIRRENSESTRSASPAAWTAPRAMACGSSPARSRARRKAMWPASGRRTPPSPMRTG
jgi:hypothetical protein